jgi:hypothetical protein
MGRLQRSMFTAMLMRKFFLLCSLMVCIGGLRAQFGPAVYIDTLNMERINLIVCADFNQDGDTDLLTLNNAWPCDFVNLYLNDGAQPFANHSAVAVADSFVTLEHVAAADINNDTWTDFVITYGFPAKIYWYENNQGSFIPHLIDDSLDYTTQLIFCDMDRNGTPDLVSLQHSEIVVYYVNTSGEFSAPQVVHSGAEFYAIQTGQFNTDQFPDIAVASTGFELLRNHEGDSFSVEWQQGIGLTFGLQAEDLDMDGDNDLVSYESLVGLVSYINDGNGHFSPHDTLLKSQETLRIFSLRDLNGDNAPDVYTSLQQTGKMIVLRNTGNGAFATPDTIHTENGNLVETTATADLNNDGKPDLVWGDKAFAWHQNLYTTSGLNEVVEGRLMVYPNPAQGVINVENNNAETMIIQVTDCYGRTYAQHKVIAGETSQLSLPGRGLFLLHCSSDDGSGGFIKKVIGH